MKSDSRLWKVVEKDLAESIDTKASAAEMFGSIINQLQDEGVRVHHPLEMNHFLELPHA